MTCKDFSGMIPDFFNDRLDNASLKAFLDHHRTCKGCREELEIQYLVGRAFEQMEAGEEVNLAKDLPDYIEKEQHRLEGRARIFRTAVILEAAAVALAVLTAVIYMM
ncbi:MAG: hypothetical protein IJG15_08290 [Lachnospiraceae bacterium]|nr:hypothetical protein [Lachnospiraceae bacterium]